MIPILPVIFCQVWHSASILHLQIIEIDVIFHFFVGARRSDIHFVSSALIKESFHDSPDTADEPRCIQHVDPVCSGSGDPLQEADEALDLADRRVEHAHIFQVDVVHPVLDLPRNQQLVYHVVRKIETCSLQHRHRSVIEVRLLHVHEKQRSEVLVSAEAVHTASVEKLFGWGCHAVLVQRIPQSQVVDVLFERFLQVEVFRVQESQQIVIRTLYQVRQVGHTLLPRVVVLRGFGGWSCILLLQKLCLEKLAIQSDLFVLVVGVSGGSIKDESGNFLAFAPTFLFF